ncbi:hypothetical protein V5O48_016299 [Marasmius crinis-equi]|uniref:Uncharacterized protein n=1 Tax=Marasmius crinis-equi TaxID=585013 RepID=A0ABR3ES35_9AGAR
MSSSQVIDSKAPVVAAAVSATDAAVVPTATARAAVFNDACSLDSASWGSGSDASAYVAALLAAQDIPKALKVVKELGSSGLSIEDILRDFMLRYHEAMQAAKVRQGLVLKLKDQVVVGRAASDKLQMESKGYHDVAVKAVKLVGDQRQTINEQSGEIRKSHHQIEIMAAHIRNLEVKMDKVSALVDNAHVVIEALAKMSTQAYRGNAISVWPSIREVVRNVTKELGQVGDDLSERQVPIPPALGAAAEWMYELGRFLSQTEAATRQLVGEVSEAALERSGVLQYLRVGVPTLTSVLSASNSFPRVPIPPHRIPFNTVGRRNHPSGIVAPPPTPTPMSKRSASVGEHPMRTRGKRARRSNWWISRFSRQ